MDPQIKITLEDLRIDSEDDHMGGYEYADTVTLNSAKYSNTIVGGGYSDLSYGAVPNSSISSPSVYTLGSNTYPYTLSTGGYSYPNVAIGAGTGINSPWYSQPASPKIRLDGEGADIEINGESMIGMLKRIEERLNILHPNDKLEAEWEELRALGEQYRKLEQHIKDKQATWDRLKATQSKID